jgi:histone deacetylase complex regulatory component SIN3
MEMLHSRANSSKRSSINLWANDRKHMSVNLQLFKIIFEEKAPRTGFALILAVDLAIAKEKWIQDCVKTFIEKYTRATAADVRNVKENWGNRWISTKLINGPFENGFIIHNSCHIY